MLVQRLDRLPLVRHGRGSVEVAGVRQETGGRVDGYFLQQGRLDAVGDIKLDVRVRRVWISVQRCLELGDEVYIFSMIRFSEKESINKQEKGVQLRKRKIN